MEQIFIYAKYAIPVVFAYISVRKFLKYKESDVNKYVAIFCALAAIGIAALMASGE